MARKAAKSKRTKATQLVGEDVVTTLAVGEEGHVLTTMIVGEEHPTTLIAGEEHPTTIILAEELTKVAGEQTPVLGVGHPAGTGSVKAPKAKRKARR